MQQQYAASGISQTLADALKTHKNFLSVFFDICFYFFSKLSEFLAGIP